MCYYTQGGVRTSSVHLSFCLFLITAQACSRPVAGPNMNLKGTDSLLQAFPEGTTVTFACTVGYESAGGSSVITCSAGIWSPVALKCQSEY